MHANFPRRQTNININFWVGLGEGEYSHFLGRSVQCDPRTLSIYHAMFSCNSTTLAILKFCATKANEKVYAL